MRLKHWLEDAEAKARSFEQAAGLTEGWECERISCVGEDQAPRYIIGEGCYWKHGILEGRMD